MKPCGHCGHALSNGADACPKCGRSCGPGVRVNPNLRPVHDFPRYSPWSDLPVIVILAAVGFYFFGIFGAIGGLALGVVIMFGH
ncbi:MAG TPA: hypothetical protein VM735_04805 [Candidatus Kapabacteria bacterium]|nr:hypothetical protein [Candidatus Kapabacteria bacterium]